MHRVSANHITGEATPRAQFIPYIACLAMTCVIGLILLLLYCPWHGCPCVTIAHGTYFAASVKNSGSECFVEYQYLLPEYNTTNCFRTDTSHMYATCELAEQFATDSDYVNFTSFYYDTRIGRCYDIGSSVLDIGMIVLAVITSISGIFAIVGLCGFIDCTITY